MRRGCDAVRLATEQLQAGNWGSRPHAFLTPVILTQFTDFVVVAKIAMVAIFPDVACVGIEERVVSPAIRELDTGVASRRHCALGLKNWFQYDRKKQSDEREDRLGVKVNAHMSASNLFTAFRGTRQIQDF
jgi:hypothetical protein